jgi:phospholipase C
MRHTLVDDVRVAIRRCGLGMLATIAVSCGAAAPPAPSTEPPNATAAVASATPTAAPSSTDEPRPRHVFVVVMENTSLSRALAEPKIAAIAERFALATNYHAVARPSLPNYLALTSGSTWDVTDSAYRALPDGGLGAQLTAAGVSWRAYMEGMTAGCFASRYPYAVNHNPFAFYGGRCPENVVSIDALDADLARDTPRLVWITPDACHDGHDCSLADAGAWLEHLVARITDASSWRAGGVLFIVWDEGDGGDASNHVALIAARAGLSGHRTDAPYDHYSLLAAIEDVLGVGRLAHAANAVPLTDLLTPKRP